FLGDMMARGTAKHSRQELKDKLDKLGAQWDFTSQVGLLSVTVKVKRANLAETLAVINEMLREPSFPEKELELLKAEVRDEVEKGRTEPEMIAGREIQRRLAPYAKDHPLYEPTIDEELAAVKSVTVADVKGVYEQLSAQVGEVGVVGDFEQEPVLKQLRATFA